jgi:hypothetical protein
MLPRRCDLDHTSGRKVDAPDHLFQISLCSRCAAMLTGLRTLIQMRLGLTSLGGFCVRGLRCCGDVGWSRPPTIRAKIAPSRDHGHRIDGSSSLDGVRARRTWARPGMAPSSRLQALLREDFTLASRQCFPRASRSRGLRSSIAIGGCPCRRGRARKEVRTPEDRNLWRSVAQAASAR